MMAMNAKRTESGLISGLSTKKTKKNILAQINWKIGASAFERLQHSQLQDIYTTSNEKV